MHVDFLSFCKFCRRPSIALRKTTAFGSSDSQKKVSSKSAWWLSERSTSTIGAPRLHSMVNLQGSGGFRVDKARGPQPREGTQAPVAQSAQGGRNRRCSGPRGGERHDSPGPAILAVSLCKSKARVFLDSCLLCSCGERSRDARLSAKQVPVEAQDPKLQADCFLAKATLRARSSTAKEPRSQGTRPPAFKTFKHLYFALEPTPNTTNDHTHSFQRR